MKNDWNQDVPRMSDFEMELLPLTEVLAHPPVAVVIYKDIVTVYRPPLKPPPRTEYN
jgi:hypothetical protein